MKTQTFFWRLFIIEELKILAEKPAFILKLTGNLIYELKGEMDMLKREDNEKLCRVSPGTPMNELFRRYWIPAVLSEELPGPDCPPVRVRLLGEDLVAFRDTNGTIGLLDAYCPHRRAHLFWGRNEECGFAAYTTAGSSIRTVNARIRRTSRRLVILNIASN